MRTTQEERLRAEQVSAAVDQVIGNPQDRPALPSGEDAALLAIAGRLARLPALLGPVDPGLEQQVMRRVRLGAGLSPRPARFRIIWAIGGAAIALLLLTLLTPLGQTAVASFLAVFHLGHTQVRITPIDTPAVPRTTLAVRETLSWEEAQARVSFPLRQPAYLPPGFRLHQVYGYSYPDLPAWVPRPFFVELVYGDDAGRTCTFHLYPISLGQDAATTGMNLEASAIHDVRDVDIDGRPGVLLQVGDERQGTFWQELVWEQEDVILSLSTADLSEAELLRIARSVGR